MDPAHKPTHTSVSSNTSEGVPFNDALDEYIYKESGRTDGSMLMYYFPAVDSINFISQTADSYSYPDMLILQRLCVLSWLISREGGFIMIHSENKITSHHECVMH